MITQAVDEIKNEPKEEVLAIVAQNSLVENLNEMLIDQKSDEEPLSGSENRPMTSMD